MKQATVSGLVAKGGSFRFVVAQRSRLDGWMDVVLSVSVCAEYHSDEEDPRSLSFRLL